MMEHPAMLEHNAFQLVSTRICVTIDANWDVLKDVGLLIEIALKKSYTNEWKLSVWIKNNHKPESGEIAPRVWCISPACNRQSHRGHFQLSSADRRTSFGFFSSFFLYSILIEFLMNVNKLYQPSTNEQIFDWENWGIVDSSLVTLFFHNNWLNEITRHMRCS